MTLMSFPQAIMSILRENAAVAAAPVLSAKQQTEASTFAQNSSLSPAIARSRTRPNLLSRTQLNLVESKNINDYDIRNEIMGEVACDEQALRLKETSGSWQQQQQQINSLGCKSNSNSNSNAININIMKDNNRQTKNYLYNRMPLSVSQQNSCCHYIQRCSSINSDSPSSSNSSSSSSNRCKTTGGSKRNSNSNSNFVLTLLTAVILGMGK